MATVEAIEQTLAVESAIEGTLSLLKDAETGQRGYILTGDEHFLEPYQAARTGIPGRLERLRLATLADPVQARRVQAIARLNSEKWAFIERTLQARRAGDWSGALSLVSGGHGKRLMDDIRTLSSQMREHEQGQLRARKQESRRAQLAAMWGVGLGSVLTCLLSLLSLLTVHRDVETLRQSAEALAASEEHFRLLAENGSDLVRLVELDGKTSYVSPSVFRLLGYSVQEFLALPSFALVHPEDLAAARARMAELASDPEGRGVLTYRMRHKSGEYRFFEVRWAAAKNESGVVTQLHIAGRDVTERKQAEDQLRELTRELQSLSVRDELTGLYNRRGFLQAASQARSAAARDGRAMAMIFSDLNGMKRINDELGHEAGDSALIDAARVLTAAHGKADVVARLGGDEFVVFAIDFSASDLDPLRRRLRELSDSETTRLKRPYRLSMSTGAALAVAGSQASLGELLEQADIAMYEQKNARRAAGNVSLPPLGKGDTR